jgi:BirA family biotin operon repressor/biotin-[acetyl-CoA-carboxylase] ligase
MQLTEKPSLPQTRAAVPLVHWVTSTESTNASLRALAASSDTPLPHGTLVATTDQTAGRGRQQREWVTPTDTALAATMLLRPTHTPGGLKSTWLPLLAGSAVAAALQPLFRAGTLLDADLRVGVKWPNDVHVRDEDDAIAGRPGLKLCGILCEVLPSGEVMVGVGINLLQEDWQLPTDRAGSVRSCGGDVSGAASLNDHDGEQLIDRVLMRTATELLRLVQLAADRPEAARSRVLRDSLTVDTEVRVHLPNGDLIDGRAVGLDDDGALIVDRPTTGQLIVHAADIEHLR